MCKDGVTSHIISRKQYDFKVLLSLAKTLINIENGIFLEFHVV